MNFADPRAGFKARVIIANEMSTEVAEQPAEEKPEEQSEEPPEEQLEEPLKGQPEEQFEEPLEEQPADEQPTRNDQDVDEVKHPLNDSWSFWYFENDRSKSWDQNQMLITTFDTVEDFWSLFDHIRSPSQILFGNDYSLFKAGIKPMWEDPANRNGGRWLLEFPERKIVHELWIDLMLSLIGVALKHDDDVCGIVFSNRRSAPKIAIWNGNAKNEEAIFEIGNMMKGSIMPLIEGAKLDYYAHKDSMTKPEFESLHSLL